MKAITLPPLFLELYGRGCEVRSSSGTVLDHLAWVYEGCQVKRPLQPQVRLGLHGDGESGYTITVEGIPVAADPSLLTALLLLDLEILRWPLFLNLPLLLIHAAWIAQGKKALLLVGEGGCGKSSLGYLLVRAGLSYGSEEVAAFSPEGKLLPFPRRILLKADNPLVTRLALKQDSRNLLARVDGRFYVLPPEMSWASPGFYDCTFVFLQFRPDGPGLQVTPLKTLEALRRLLAAAFSLKGLGSPLFSILVQALGPDQALALKYASLEEACSFLVGLVNG